MPLPSSDPDTAVSISKSMCIDFVRIYPEAFCFSLPMCRAKPIPDLNESTATSCPVSRARDHAMKGYV